MIIILAAESALNTPVTKQSCLLIDNWQNLFFLRYCLNCDQAVMGLIPSRAAINLPTSTQPSIPRG